MNGHMSFAEVYRRQAGRCFYCRQPMANRIARRRHPNGYTLDHFYPRSRGFNRNHGKVLAHRPCNEAKGDRMPTPAEIERFRQLFGVAPEPNRTGDNAMYRITLDRVENGHIVRFESGLLDGYKRVKIAKELDESLGIADEFVAKHAMDVEAVRAKRAADQQAAEPLTPPVNAADMPAGPSANRIAAPTPPKAPPPPPAPKSGKAAGAKAH